MEAILEVILEVFLEMVLQIFWELLFELGLRSALEKFQPKQVRSPWLAGFGFLLLGMAIGGISLLIVGPLIHNHTMRVVNLFLTPILAGLVMMAIGAFRRKRGQLVIRLDRFGYGFVFAFGMALVRFYFAK